MKWEFSSDAPIYAQLILQIKVGIVSGMFPPGERLPSVRDLATEAGVNPNTMQRALTELERDGLVYSQRTAGRFVTEDKAMIDSAKRGLAEGHIKAFLAAMTHLGYQREEIVSLLEQEPAAEVNEEELIDVGSGM
ncbi:DNA-binding transcriptional regulator YhcF, GntR family [Oscillibacter sp. PC13]|uniref:GntR family transcriptional regulator n=1 Tax=Oscillibacter sp. PC13 TaxID=1855299 RepID=UPI0008DF334B|nr:GntR family transcriptional regulator [Oscillibacter sp. PC13]SFP49593.1 DNA-binding transcriptional regulator YhcF, GntR family [Oscillibacter sp. PC13]